MRTPLRIVACGPFLEQEAAALINAEGNLFDILPAAKARRDRRKASRDASLSQINR